MDRTNPMDKHMEVMINRYGMAAAPAAPQMFGNAGREHMEKYGTCVKVCNVPVVPLHLPHAHTLEQSFNLFQGQNLNTLPKLPGRTTSILPTTRKTLKTDNFLRISSNSSSSCVNMCPSLCRYSQFQDEYSLEQVKGSRKVFDFLTLLQCW